MQINWTSGDGLLTSGNSITRWFCNAHIIPIWKYIAFSPLSLGLRPAPPSSLARCKYFYQRNELIQNAGWLPDTQGQLYAAHYMHCMLALLAMPTSWRMNDINKNSRLAQDTLLVTDFQNCPQLPSTSIFILLLLPQPKFMQKDFLFIAITDCGKSVNLFVFEGFWEIWECGV